jgi:hypothetical protein
MVSAAGGTPRNLPVFVELDVWRQVAGKIDAIAIRQVIFQSELIRGGINLAKIVDAGVRRACAMLTNTIWYRNGYK